MRPGLDITVTELQFCVCFLGVLIYLMCVCPCVCVDMDLDAVVSSTEKLSHPTVSRPRVTDRRPRSQIVASVSFY